MTSPELVLEPFVKQWAVLLTTYKRDGTPVETAVNIVVDGDHAYFRTWDTAWKIRRLENNPEVEVAPCTPLGRKTGPAIGARTRVLEGKEAAHARRLLARKYPVMHGIMVPLVHRLRGNETMHIELRPADDASRHRGRETKTFIGRSDARTAVQRDAGATTSEPSGSPRRA